MPIRIPKFSGRSLGLARETADRFNEAGILDRLGDVHASAGNQDAARWAWMQALRTFDAIDHPEGDRIRAKVRLQASASPWPADRHGRKPVAR